MTTNRTLESFSPTTKTVHGPDTSQPGYQAHKVAPAQCSHASENQLERLDYPIRTRQPRFATTNDGSVCEVPGTRKIGTKLCTRPPGCLRQSQLVSYPGPEGVEPLSRRDTPTRTRDSIIKRPNMCPQVNSKNDCYATVGITWFTNTYPEQDP